MVSLNSIHKKRIDFYSDMCYTNSKINVGTKSVLPQIAWYLFGTQNLKTIGNNKYIYEQLGLNNRVNEPLNHSRSNKKA